MIDIRPFDFRRDWKPFCQLYQKTFGHEVNKTYCDWKFLNNPFGEAFGFAAWDSDKLIGFVSVWPLRFCFDGEDIIACSGGDTMVDIEYRKQGLFTRLTQILLEEMNKRGWLFRYSAPGTMSYPGYIRKLNHRLIDILPYRVKFHPGRMIYKKLFNTPNKKIDNHFSCSYHDLTVRTLDKFDDAFDQLWEDTKSQFRLSVQRSSRFLNWRYCQHPFYSYLILSCEDKKDLVGFAIIRGANLVELWGKQDLSVYMALLNSAEKLWKTADQAMTHSWFTGDPLIDIALKNNGWRNYTFRKRILGLYLEQPLICYGNPNFRNSTAIFDSSIWRFSMGDVDSM
jgi:hypothetical protein